MTDLKCSSCQRSDVRVFNWLRRLLCADCIVSRTGTTYPR